MAIDAAEKNPFWFLEIEDITLAKQDSEAEKGLVKQGARWISETAAGRGAGGGGGQ